MGNADSTHCYIVIITVRLGSRQHETRSRTEQKDLGDSAIIQQLKLKVSSSEEDPVYACRFFIIIGKRD